MRISHWHDHIDNLITKINQILGYYDELNIVYNWKHSVFFILLWYIIWGDNNNSVLINSLQILENKAAKLMLDAPPLSSATHALKLLNWTPFGIRRHKHRCIVITQEQAKTYIYLKSTETGENKTQAINLQMTTINSIIRLKTPILSQNSRLFQKD